MSVKYKLSSAQRDKIKDFLPGKESDPGRSAQDNRRFIEGELWIGENGCKWRSLPEEVWQLGQCVSEISSLGE